jgi:glycosyltransferase involved in cell wall biosynthesis
VTTPSPQTPSPQTPKLKTLVAIPAYNEELSLGAVLASLKQHHPLEHVVVIDDGSADETSRVARESGVRVIRHAVNLGVGAAVGTAFQFAAANGYVRMIQFDADGQHRPEHLDEMLAHLSDDVDIVVGSRFAAGGRFKTTATRRAVMRVIAGVVSLYTRTKLTDVTSGFRVSSERAIQLFSIHYPVEYLGDTVESLVFASRQGLRIKEVPVLMNERLAGLPSQSVARASLYTGRILLILVLALFRSAPPNVKKARKA